MPKRFFRRNKKPKYSPDLSLQQIYYGAPGTGKSKAIKDLTFGEDIIRTTFHPDSDYASLLVLTNLLQKKLYSEIAMAKGH